MNQAFVNGLLAPERFGDEVEITARYNTYLEDIGTSKGARILLKELDQGLSLAREESTTPVWFALRLGPSTFGSSMLLTTRPRLGSPHAAKCPAGSANRHFADANLRKLLHRYVWHG